MLYCLIRRMAAGETGARFPLIEKQDPMQSAEMVDGCCHPI